MKLKGILILLFAAGLVNNAVSQAIFAKGEELWQCTKMKMVVELLEEDRGLIDDLSKKIEKKKDPDVVADLKDELAAHRRFVAHYNEFIQQAVKASWTHNENIEYVPSSQVDMMRAKKEEVVILSYAESDGYSINLLGKEYNPRATLGTISYSRPSSAIERPDIYMYLPFAGHRSETGIALGDLIFALKLMDRQMKVIFESGEKRIQLRELATQDIEKNCIHLADAAVKMDARFIGRKQSFATLDEAFPGKLVKSNLDEITQLIETGADEIVTIAIPYRIKRGTGGDNEIEFMKVMINLKSMAFYMSHGTEGGESSDLYYTSKVFKKAIDCK